MSRKVYFKFYEEHTPEEFDLAATTKGLFESVEGYIEANRVMKKKSKIVIETLTEAEYDDQLKRK